MGYTFLFSVALRTHESILNCGACRKLLLEQKLGGGKLKKWDNVDTVSAFIHILDLDF